jgi:hypothetical protein
LERLNLLTLHNRRHHFDALLVINVSVCPLWPRNSRRSGSY